MRVYTCPTATLLEILCHSSIIAQYKGRMNKLGKYFAVLIFEVLNLTQNTEILAPGLDAVLD